MLIWMDISVGVLSKVDSRLDVCGSCGLTAFFVRHVLRWFPGVVRSPWARSRWHCSTSAQCCSRLIHHREAVEL